MPYAAVEMTRMFVFASSYNNNLCAWGRLLRPATVVTDMFLGTNCSDPYLSPSLEESPPGPFCSSCFGQNQTVRSRVEGPFTLPLVPAAVTQRPDNVIVGWSGDRQLGHWSGSLPKGTFTCKFNVTTKNSTVLRVESK